MNDENELLEPLATEAGQEAIARAIRDISSLEYAVRAELAASTASTKAGEAFQSAIEASEAEDKAKDWATKTDTYVEQETITIPPEQEGEEPTTETINLYSARYYAALALDIYNNMSFDSVPTENSTNMVNSGTVYSALDLKADKINTYTKTEVDTLISTAVSNLVNSAPSTLDTLEELADALGDDPNFATTIATLLGLKADKSTTYTKTEIDTALSNVQSTLTFDSAPTQNSTNPVTSGGLYTAFLNVLGSLIFDNAPTLNSDNPVKSGGIYTALASKLDALTFDNSPTANSDNPVKSSGIKTALDGKQDILTFDSTPTANSTNPVTSGGVYTALQNVDANIEVDTEITENSDNPVTSAAIYEALLNFTPSGSGDVITTYPNYSRAKSINLSGYITQAGQTYIAEGDGYITFSVESHVTGWSIYVTVNNIRVWYRYIKDSKYVDNPFFAVSKGDVVKVYGNNPTQSEQGTITDAYFIPANEALLSEQMYSNVLYENLSSGFSSGTLTLSDEWDNYDFIVFLYSHPQQTTSATGGNKFMPDNKIFYKKELNDLYTNEGHVLLTGYDNRFMSLNIGSDKKTFSISERTDTNILGVYGYKLAKGGYSGIVSDARMTVKSGVYEHSSTVSGNGWFNATITFDSPMPDANYEVLISRSSGGAYWADIQATAVDKTPNGFTLGAQNTSNHTTSTKPKFDWIAIRPNSYTREGMVEDVLFSNASGVNSGTINLSGNISDYDLIEFTTLSSNGRESYPSIINSIDLISRNSSDSYFVISGYNDNYVQFYCGSDNQLVFCGNQNHKITKITGIKFGRYVSGVAIDDTITSSGTGVPTTSAVYLALQNIPSGGGSGGSITVDNSITQNSTNPVESAAIYTALASKGDVTTNTDQNITGTKTFVGSKKVGFKQSASNDKLGFTLYSNSNAERGYLEFNPTNTVDGVAGLMTLGNYATSAASLTQVGFRRYSNISGASGAYNLLMPMVADARTPFSLTTSYTNFYLPLGFTDGTTTVKTAKSGLVDLSPLLASLEARIAALEGN